MKSPYSAFGEDFIVTAVTPERVVASARQIAGDKVELGPLRAGPGGAATVTATGWIGEPTAEELATELLSYAVRLPVDLDLEVRIGPTGRFLASGHIELRLTVRTETPPAIVIDVGTVRPGDVHLTIEARGVQAKLLQRAGDIDSELRRHAARYVNEKISSPQARQLTRVDLVPLIDRVWNER
jgi:hypothetical protein